MGWDVDLIDENGVVQVPKHSAGSIISIDAKTGEVGQSEASMLVTYNYSGLYYLAIGKSLPDFLDGKKAKDTIEILKLAVEKLGTNQYKRPRDNTSFDASNLKKHFDDYIIDYWAPTMGNAGHIASILLDWALLHPEAVWRISK